MIVHLVLVKDLFFLLYKHFMKVKLDFIVFALFPLKNFIFSIPFLNLKKFNLIFNLEYSYKQTKPKFLMIRLKLNEEKNFIT